MPYSGMTKLLTTVFKPRSLAVRGSDIREGRRAALSSTWEGIGQMAVAGVKILEDVWVDTLKTQVTTASLKLQA